MSMVWGSVSAVSPLRVTLDGDTVALPYVPESLVDPAYLTVNDRVRCELSNRRVVIVGRSGGGPGQSRRNLIRNARFRVNQRGAVSGASLANNEYFLDGWASTAASNPITWTGDAESGRDLTIPAGPKNLGQVIERRDVIPGDYILVWEGTVDARVYNVGEAGVVYNSPNASGRTVLPVTLDGLNDVRVQFRSGAGDSRTLLQGVMLVRANADPGYFPDISIDEDIRWCRRFYRQHSSAVANAPLSATGFQISTTAAALPLLFDVEMRTVPTLTYGGTLNWADRSTFTKAVTSLALGAAGQLSVDVEINWSGGAGAQHRPGNLRSSDGSGWFAFSAEL